MRRRTRLTLVAIVCGAIVLAVNPVMAQAAPPGDDGIIIWNEDFELESGGIQSNDVVVINGDVTLNSGSRIEGVLVVWNGDVVLDGSVEGDLVVIGGSIELGSDAVVGGNVICSWNCVLSQTEGARIEGKTVEGFTFEALDEWLSSLDVELPTFGVTGLPPALSLLFRLVRTAFGVLVVAALAALVRAMWPEQTSQVAAVITSEPLASVGLGALLAVVTCVVLSGLLLTICLSPVAFIGAMVAIAVGLYGWACLGSVVGERLFAALNVNNVSPPLSAAIGAFLLSVLTTGVTAVPYVGPLCLGPIGALVALALTCLGVGAVVLTRFGTTAYPVPDDEVVAEPAPKPKRARKKKA